MNISEINKLKQVYLNNKTKSALQEAKDAKAVMFGEDMQVIFETYRISETNEEIKRRIQLAKPANQGEFESVISYISNFFDLDVLNIEASEEVLNWIATQELEQIFTDTVLPTMLASPNSFICLVPKLVGTQLDADVVVVPLDRVIYEDSSKFLFYETEEDKANIIVLTAEYVEAYTYNGTFINRFDYNTPTTKYWFKLGGLKKLNHPSFYSSYFKGAIDKSIIATRIFSDKEIVRMRVGNPIVFMKKLPCNVCKGTDPSCSTCDGTGYITPAPSMGSVFYFEEYDLPGGGKASQLDDILKYVQPPLESVEVQQKQYTLHVEEVQRSLNSFYYNHAQSGVAKELDRENKVATTEVILFRLVGLLESILNAYSYLVTIDKQPVIVTTPSEMVVDTSNSIDVVDKPSAYVLDKTLNYYKTKYKDDAVMLRLIKYAILTDSLFAYAPSKKREISNDEAEINFSNNLPLILMKVREKYSNRIRQATDATIQKWVEEFSANN